MAADPSLPNPLRILFTDFTTIVAGCTSIATITAPGVTVEMKPDQAYPVSRLATICDEADAIYRDISPFGALFRSLIHGIDFSGYTRTLAAREEEVFKVGRRLLSSDHHLPNTLELRHWCLVQLAVSSLLEFNQKWHQVIWLGNISGERSRRGANLDFVNAIRGARRLEERLLVRGRH